MAVRNGRYRHKITIETVSEVTDSHGQAIKTWTIFAQPFASVEPLQGKEYLTSNAYDSDVTVRIRLQHLSGVTTKMRVSFDSRIYNIRSVINPWERGREMQLMCDEGLNDG